MRFELTSTAKTLQTLTMVTQAKNLIGSREASKRLGVSVPTLSRWVKSGRIAATKPLDHPTAPLIFEESEVERIRRALEELKPRTTS